MRSAGEVRVLGVDPAHGDEDWRARVGVVLQSWRDHARWTPRRLLEPPRRLLRAVLDAGAPAALRGRRADRHSSGSTEHADQQDRHPLRRPAAAARRRRRHRRPARAAVPRRADGGLRPAGAPRLPRPGPPARRPRGHDDPAHHPRPRRGRAARRPHPHPRRRPRSSPTAAPTSSPGRSPAEAEVRWTPRRRAVRARHRRRHRRSSASLLDQHGDAITDLEVRRASLEDTYLAMVQRHEPATGPRPSRVAGGRPMNPHLATRSALGLRRGWTEFVLQPAQPAGPGLLPVHRRVRLLLPVVQPRQRGRGHRPARARRSPCPASSARCVAFGVVIGPAYALAMEREDGTLLRAKAVPARHAAATSPASWSSTRSGWCRMLARDPRAERPALRRRHGRRRRRAG